MPDKGMAVQDPAWVIRHALMFKQPGQLAQASDQD
jgi:hypothetical protein